MAAVRGSWIGLMAALALVGAAAAQPAPKPAPKPVDRADSGWIALTAAEAKKELFGVDLAGGIEGDPAYRWRECIDPKGFTLYQHDGIEERGQLTINARGEACFAYPPGNKNRLSCFSARRTLKGFDFRGFGALFHATSARRVDSCDNQKLSALDAASHGG